VLHGTKSRSVGIQLGEHTKNLKQRLVEKSMLAMHVFEGGNCLQWKEARVVQMEASNICRKCKELARMANPINQRSLEIHPIWIAHICEEVSRLQGSSL
jgi:hypothetical protein